MKFLGMGVPELIIILVVILLIFGPKNLPKLGKAFGKTVSNLREGMNEGKKKVEEGDGQDAAAADGNTAEGPRETPALEAAAEDAAEAGEDAVDVGEPDTAGHAEPVFEPEETVADPESATEIAEAPKKVVKKVVRKKA